MALAAAVLLPATVLVGGSGWLLIPALFLLGSALVWQLGDLEGSNVSTSSAVAGLALAGVYVTGILVLLRTPLQRCLRALFAPLGRMALTNYVAATPVMVLAGHLLDWQHGGSWTQVLGVAAAILVVQWMFSTLWLRSFRQGPLEWLWRWATWSHHESLSRQR